MPNASKCSQNRVKYVCWNNFIACYRYGVYGIYFSETYKQALSNDIGFRLNFFHIVISIKPPKNEQNTFLPFYNDHVNFIKIPLENIIRLSFLM